jgi:hypothetical protein
MSPALERLTSFLALGIMVADAGPDDLSLYAIDAASRN